MPVIKSAIKKLRKDKVRTARNDIFRKTLEQAVRSAKKQKTAKSVSAAVSQLDRAVKKNMIHKNRAARIKSALAKLSRPSKGGTKPVNKVPVTPSKSKRPRNPTVSA